MLDSTADLINIPTKLINWDIKKRMVVVEEQKSALQWSRLLKVKALETVHSLSVRIDFLQKNKE